MLLAEELRARRAAADGEASQASWVSKGDIEGEESPITVTEEVDTSKVQGLPYPFHLVDGLPLSVVP